MCIQRTLGAPVVVDAAAAAVTGISAAAPFSKAFAAAAAAFLPLDMPAPVAALRIALSLRPAIVLEVSDLESSIARGRAGAMLSEGGNSRCGNVLDYCFADAQ